ncbi:MAG: acetamidase/formamidase family protein, partial [Alphaproteobacteria bacterium]
MTTTHQLNASAQTCHWGCFAADIPPVLEIASGDTVTVQAISGAPAVLPPPGYNVPDAYADVHANVKPPFGGGHILTGPVRVAGAMPGDALEVHVKKIALGTDWGW